MRHLAGIVVVLAASWLTAGERSAPEPPQTEKRTATYAPTEQYEAREIEGWRVLVNKAFIEKEPKLCDEALTLLRFQLFQIPRMVPAKAVARLRKVTLWVEENEPHHPCMAYHPNPQWLKDHGMNPDKAPCVEVANARNFLTWTREQPWMVLHELAHGYHHQFLPGGHGNPEVRAAYERAKEKKLYESVLRYNASSARAYAMNNPMEYFAETTEAFFGTNDFYPFVNAELRKHDPEMHALLTKLWSGEEPEKKSP